MIVVLAVVVACLAAPVALALALAIVEGLRGWRDGARESKRRRSGLGERWERHQSERLGFSSRVR